MEKTVYIRMRNRILVRPGQNLFIGEIAQILAPETIGPSIKKMTIYQVTKTDSNFVVIDAMMVIKKITEIFPEVEIQAVGPAQTLIEVEFKKSKGLTLPLFILIWLLLFFGSAMAIMNFHDDVSMKSVQSKLYTIITGERTDKPLLFQVPYSLGLGLGMILFFNHIFKKRINEEPSPLEVEMFNYQQALDSYVILHENKESMKRLDND